MKIIYLIVDNFKMGSVALGSATDAHIAITDWEEFFF
jgi:hypothetical protein